MSNGTGTSFNQQYNTTYGGIISQPHHSSVGGNIASYENGIGATSTNYSPNISLVGGGRRSRTKKRKFVKKNKLMRRRKSKKTCSLCQRFIWN